METLKEVSEEVAEFVGESGTCPDSEIVRKDINRARRLLYKLGDWKGTTQDLLIQSYGGTITLPAAYEFIIKSWTHMRDVELLNEWWAVLTMGLEHCACGCVCKPVKMTEPVITFRDLKWDYPEECYFRAEIMFESYNEEPGTEIIVHGYDKEAQKRSLKRIFDKAYKGETADPINDFYFRSVYQVTKPKTDGRIRMKAINPVTGVEQVVGLWEESDINPTMTRYLVSGRPCEAQYVVTAKKKYMPLVDDSDPVELPTEALIHGLRALTARKDRDDGAFQSQVAAAMGYLDRELGENHTNELGRIKTVPSQVHNLVEDGWW